MPLLDSIDVPASTAMATTTWYDQLYCCAVLCCHADDKTTGSKDNNPNGPGCEDGAKAKAVKEKLAKALSDDEAAWGEYVQQYGAGSVLNLAAGPKTQALPAAARANAFKNKFKAALREMDKLNREAEAAGDDAVAFGINSQAHLDAEDFAALRTTGLSHAAAPDAGRKLNQACSSSSGDVPYTLGGTSPAAAVNWLASGFVTTVKDQVRGFDGCGLTPSSTVVPPAQLAL